MRVLQVYWIVLELTAAGPEEDRGAGPGAEARRLFDLGDYPGAEREIDRAIGALPGGSSAERALLLARRGEARALQGVFESAAADVAEALRLSTGRPVRLAAVSVFLRARRYADALPHAAALLAEAPGDRALELSRGIALAKLGRFEDALPGLERGLELEAGRRDARFELALALSRLSRPAEALERLRAILEEDPCDAEACYQASRQLLALRRPEASQQAAVLTRYFEALRAQEGASSRGEHLAFEGKAALAALERAARHERLGRYDRTLAECERARVLAPGSPEVEAFLDAFWRRQGFEGGREPPREALDAAFGAASAAGDAARATRLARLVLARDPRRLDALERLERGARDPSLMVPRLHYVRRLAELEASRSGGSSTRWRDELARLRRAFAGDSPPR